MAFDSHQLILRFKIWCYTVLDLMKTVGNDYESQVMKRQVIRSSTSSYMNYRATCRAKSAKDMIHKLKIVEEETDESMGWLEMISDRNSLINTSALIKEGDELLRIIVTSIKTLKSRL